MTQPMTKLYADILAIIEKATRENALPEGITENNAEYLAEIIRGGARNV